MAGRRGAVPALITSARVPRSLDTDERMRRYLISMGIRVVFFLAGCLSPLPWNILLFLGAAVIPTFAVILANAVDRRTASVAPQATPGRLELTPGIVVQGDVDRSPGAA